MPFLTPGREGLLVTAEQGWEFRSPLRTSGWEARRCLVTAPSLSPNEAMRGGFVNSG